MAAAVSMARHFRVERIALPTNGNAGAALAAYAARAGMQSLVICPAETPEINVNETAAFTHGAARMDPTLRAAASRRR